MIPKPADYKLPKDAKVGETFEELVTFRLDPEDYLVPVAIAGVEIPEEEKEDEMPEEDASLGENIMEGMGGMA